MTDIRGKLRLTFAILAMLVVAALFFGITLRVALHGGEVPVPSFSGMSVSEASDAALNSSLDLNIEDKYYSTTVPAGRVLSQSPAAGSRVRKHWLVRVAVSLGPQQVTIPDVVGQPQREATLTLRRASLDLGNVLHLDAPGDPDMVIAQTPPPDAGVDQPRVSLLVSQAAGSASSAFVLPSFIGVGYATASHAATAMGLRIASVTDSVASAAPAAATASPAGTGTATSAAASPDANASATPAVVMTPSAPSGNIGAQRPAAGARVNRGDTVRVYFGHAAERENNPQPAAQTP